MKMLITLIAICGGFAVAFFGVIVLFNFHVLLGFILCLTGIASAIMGTKIYEWTNNNNLGLLGYGFFSMAAR